MTFFFSSFFKTSAMYNHHIFLSEGKPLPSFLRVKNNNILKKLKHKETAKNQGEGSRREG